MNTQSSECVLRRAGRQTASFLFDEAALVRLRGGDGRLVNLPVEADHPEHRHPERAARRVDDVARVRGQRADRPPGIPAAPADDIIR